MNKKHVKEIVGFAVVHDHDESIGKEEYVRVQEKQEDKNEVRIYKEK
jgi:hypothetical protein